MKLRGSQAATNFALSNYNEQLKEYHTNQHKEILQGAKAKKKELAAKQKPEVSVKPEPTAVLTKTIGSGSLTQTIVPRCI